jgi:two-component system NtrC family sensor kinase
LQQRTNELEALVRIGTELNQGLALDELADHILSAVLDQVPASNAALILVNAEQEPVLSRFCGWEDADPSAERLLASSTLPGHVLQDGEAVLVSDTGSDASIPAIFDGLSCFSGVAAPLIHHGQTIGVLALGDTTPGYFAAADLRLLRSIAQEAALAIRNAQLYTELQAYAQNLEAMVEARTAALQSAQAQLFRAEKLAALGTLAAGIAHEVNNPLQPILTNLEMALEDFDAERPVDRELLDFAKRDVQRIQGIVSRLLDFARPARRELEPDGLAAVDLNAIVREVLTLAGKQLEHSRIKVETQLAAARGIRGNTDQLKQVVLNLIVNAMEAMPDGGTLTMSTVEQDGHVLLTVQDTGVGIGSDELPRLFDPFFTTKPDGTGLGLSVSYGIITDHGGQIEVESAPGQFTRFIIRLPTMADDR